MRLGVIQPSPCDTVTMMYTCRAWALLQKKPEADILLLNRVSPVSCETGINLGPRTHLFENNKCIFYNAISFDFMAPLVPEVSITSLAQWEFCGDKVWRERTFGPRS